MSNQVPTPPVSKQQLAMRIEDADEEAMARDEANYYHQKELQEQKEKEKKEPPIYIENPIEWSNAL